MDEGKKIFGVAEINEYIKMIIDADAVLSSVFLRGEISNFTNHYKTGHLYFSLKDEGGCIRAVMFRSSAMKLRFAPENGMKVVIHGRISVFARDGQYQLYADSIEPDGVGALYIAYEQLKKKLAAEGLFADELKRPIPKIPSRIGVITSPTGAAVRDIMNILGRRFPLAEVILYPALVQGAGAAPSLVAGIGYFSSKTASEEACDVIIIGRGGGSIEDLWAFNDERLARAIRACPVPVISAVGHETDFTICDFVADLRAPTPSAAAELAVPDTSELKRKIGNVTGYMTQLLIRNMKAYRERLTRYSACRALTSPGVYIDDRRMAVLDMTRRLEGSAGIAVSAKRADLREAAAKLSALNPISVLTRGYSAVFGDGNKVVKSTGDVSVGESVTVRVSDGSINAVVNGIIPSKKTKSRKTDNGKE